MTGTLEAGALEKARCRATVRLAVRLRLLLSLRPLMTCRRGHPERTKRASLAEGSADEAGHPNTLRCMHRCTTWPCYTTFDCGECASQAWPALRSIAPAHHLAAARRCRARPQHEAAAALAAPSASPPARGRGLAPQRLRRRTQPLPATPNHSQPSSVDLIQSQYNLSRSPSISVELVAHRDVARLARDRGELRRRGPHALPRLGAHRPRGLARP